MLMHQLTENLPSGLASLINYLSLAFHFESFSRGLLDSRDMAFFLITTILFLFLNTQVLVYRRWK
jgi:ABC-2 type transport system permease protein